MSTHLWFKISYAYALYVKIMTLNLIMAGYVPEMYWFLEYVPEKNYGLWLICDLKYPIYALFSLKIWGVNPIMAEYVPEMYWFLEYIPEYHIRANGILVISAYKTPFRWGEEYSSTE